MSRSLSWRELSIDSKLYLSLVYAAAIPASYACLFWLAGSYSPPWLLLTLTSLLVAVVAVRLPRTATVLIFMGDVFTILALIYFGAGPALVTSWVGSVTASLADFVRRHGIFFYRKILFYRLAFNIAAAPIAVLPISLLFFRAMDSALSFPASLVVGLALVALAWFLINTVTLALAVSSWTDQTFWAVWKNGLGLYFLSFLASAAFAGLITLLYRTGDIYIFILAIPVAVLLQQLYSYHADQAQQAQAHIDELNKLYQQAIRTQEAQSRSEARYRNLVEAASDAIFSLSPEREITSLNTAFEKITGWTTAEWIGRPFDELVHADDRGAARKGLTSALEGRTVLLPELRFLRKAGGVVFVECTAAPHVQGEQVIGLLGIARDMTERNRLADSLRQSQKMEAIGRLAGGVAHDFNNILVAILGYSEMLLEHMSPTDRGRHMAETILKSGEQAAGLTRQLLAFSRKQMIQPVVLDLNAIVRKMDLMLRRVIGEDIELVLDLETPLGAIKADPTQIEQALLNLAVNSRDAMPTGGQLTITTRNVSHRETDRFIKWGTEPGSYVMVTVSDTGAGIAPELQSLVFEPFFTTKEICKGTGLGLATVYGIVKQSGGYIGLESAANQGAAFHILLPRIDDEVTPHVVTQRSLRLSATETVLLVEDEDAVRSLASISLKRAGYTVLEARSGEEALKTSAQQRGPIDVLVTDIVMPQMSGLELADKLRSARPGIRVLYMSGYSDDVISHHGVLHAGSAFLQKPFRPNELAAKVDDLLQSLAD